MKKTIIVGMSGGVDSSACAALLLERGYNVIGVTMIFNHSDDVSENCLSRDALDAKNVCKILNIPHYILDCTKLFKEKVVDYFIRSYINGKTPNPCVKCNESVKFKALYEMSLKLGADYIATGHYARIQFDEYRNKYLILKSASKKDQSYVLYSLSQKILSRLILPVDNLSKDETRAVAAKYNLPVSDKPDSQEICFIKNNNYSGFILENSDYKDTPGDFLDTDNNIIGLHKGIIHYTIGQRKGLGITFGRPMYVCGIDSVNNTVTLGPQGSQYYNEIIAEDLSFISIDGISQPTELYVKPRYLARPVKAMVSPLDYNSVLIELESPGRAITPGQAIVFYNSDVVVGGGIIKSMK